MKKAIFLLINCFISVTLLVGQTRPVSGVITDQQTNEGLSGVSVKVQGTEIGTATDVAGRYTINVPAGSKFLSLSMVGYPTQEISINNQNVVNVQMVADATIMNEVVVTALGIRRETKKLTYATQQVKGKDLAEVKDATGSLANALSGKVAGLTVTQASSGPGGANRVVLRGNRSISGSNNALFVIDGVAIDNSSGAQSTSTFGGNNPSDGAGNINPDDIESVNVLKGASAAALYGSRAANGVIIITTKKGKSGKASVDVNSGISVSTPSVMPRWQNVYGQGNGGGIYDPKAERSWGPKMDGQTVTDWKGKPSTLTPQPDNINDFFRDALTINNSVGISAGNEKTQAYFSYTNNLIEGLIPTNELNRHTLNLRMNTQVSEKFSVEGKFTYMDQGIDNKPLVGEIVGATIYTLFQVPRSIRTADMEDFETINASGVRSQNYWLPGSSVLHNPYWEMNRRVYNEDRSRITAYGLAKYNLTSWLTAQFRYSLDRYTDRLEQKDFAGNYYLASAIGSGRYGLGTNYVNERNMDFLLSGNNRLNKDFTIDYNVGGQVLRRNREYNYNLTGPLIYPELFIPSNSATLAPSYDYSLRELQGLYATTQISFRDYLTLDLTGRNDWSSTLPAANRSYFYPSVGVSAIISDMTELPSWVSFGKARASFSQVGNDASPYSLNQTYTVQQGGLNGWLRPGSIQVLGDELKPEITRAYEVGLDWRFFNNRFGIDLTLYKTNTINQLLTLSLPAASGYGSKYINAGNIENKGVEIVLSGTPYKGKRFSWNTTLNIAANRNKVVELDENLKKANLTTERIANLRVDEGGRIGELYTDGWATDAKTGQLLVDNNGLPVITPAFSKYMGNYNPEWMLGFNNTVRYGNFSLGFLLEGRIGGIVVSGGDALRTFNGSVESTLPFRDGGWVLPGIVQSTGVANSKAINAEQFWSKMGGKTPRGEVYTYDATNYRVREVNFGYTFGNIHKVIRSARVALVARNLFFLYRGKSVFDIPGIGKRTMDFDPDATLGAGNVQGLENQSLPTPRTIGLNVTLSF